MEKIEILQGRSWIYRGKIIKILEVNIKTFHVSTDSNGGYRFDSIEDLEYFAQECKAIDENTGVMIADAKGEDVMLQLLDGLVSDFKKLETDPNYVQQAKQRSNQVNTAINLAKLRLQMTGKK